MSTFYEIDGMRPVVGKDTFIDPHATIIGDVIIHDRVYIGPNAVLRGDLGRIEIHNESNIQDNCLFHGWPTLDTVVSERGHIGHNAVVHGARLERNVLVGMGAVILEKVVVGESAIVGAGSLVLSDTKIPPRTLAVGSPAKIQRPLRQADLDWKTQLTDSYIRLTARSIATLKETEPLREVEEGRKRVQDLYPIEMRNEPK